MAKTFKEWLEQKKIVAESDAADSGSNYYFGNYVYPTDASDWQYAHPSPVDYYLLQARWKYDKEHGRKFINIDPDPIINQKFTDIKSNTLPGDEDWKHRPDNRPNLTINSVDLLVYGVQENPGTIKKVGDPTNLLDMTEKLNKTFGQFTSKYVLASDDTPWTSNKLGFKEWLEHNDDVALVESVLEMFTQAATEMGSALGANDEKLNAILDSFVSAIAKVDKWIGVTKFLSMLPKAVYAKFMFVFALVKFVKNPLDRSNRENLLHWISEVGKLSVYSGATIPLAMLIGNLLAPGIGEVIAAGLAKAVSYGYFYMGQWAENMKDHPEHGEFARKILKLLPQIVMKAHDKEPSSIPALAASILPQNTDGQKSEDPQRPKKSSSFLSRLWPGKRPPASSSGDTTP